MAKTLTNEQKRIAACWIIIAVIFGLLSLFVPAMHWIARLVIAMVVGAGISRGLLETQSQEALADQDQHS